MMVVYSWCYFSLNNASGVLSYPPYGANDCNGQKYCLNYNCYFELFISHNDMYLVVSDY